MVRPTYTKYWKVNTLLLMPTQLHCYLVQKTHWNAVFHPTKLASGANYPVGWVQMPHSVKIGGGMKRYWARAKTEGGGEGGSREHSHPGVRSLCLFTLTSGPNASAVLGFILNLDFHPARVSQELACSFAAILWGWTLDFSTCDHLSDLTGETHICSNIGWNNPHLCVFARWLRQWHSPFHIFNWKGAMAPHGNPSVQVWATVALSSPLTNKREIFKPYFIYFR